MLAGMMPASQGNFKCKKMDIVMMSIFFALMTRSDLKHLDAVLQSFVLCFHKQSDL